MNKTSMNTKIYVDINSALGPSEWILFFHTGT